MSSYVIGHKPHMMERFIARAKIDGSIFISPVLPKTGTIVDIGCGNAALTSWVADSHPNLNVIGLDSELHMIKTVPINKQNITLIEANTFNLPIHKNSVDLVYLHAVCMYLSPIEPALSEIYRILKSGARLAIRNGLSVINNMDLFLDSALFNKVLSFNQEKNKDNPNIAFKLTTLLNEAGFHTLKTKTSIETSKSGEDIKKVALSSIELLENKIGTLALQANIVSQTELDDLKSGLMTWAHSNKAYNRALWLEHHAVK